MNRDAAELRSAEVDTAWLGTGASYCRGGFRAPRAPCYPCPVLAKESRLIVNRKYLWMPLFVLASGVGTPGCGDDDEKENGEELSSPACKAISEACHAADSGSGEAHECHELAHQDVEAPCALEKESCVAVCEHAH